MQTTCLLPSRDEPQAVSGPLSQFRQRQERFNPAARRPGDESAWTVDFMPDAPKVGTLAEAAAIARNWNEWKRSPGMPMAVPRMVRPSDDKPSTVRPGCQTVEIDAPADLWKTFTQRCELVGADPSRLVAAMILLHCTNRDPANFADGAIRNLEGWERSKKRGVRPWPETVAE